MRPRIIDHAPVVKAAQQDAREMAGRLVLAALARLRARAMLRNQAPAGRRTAPGIILAWRPADLTRSRRPFVNNP